MPPLTPAEAAALLAQVPQWELADAEGHHPEIAFGRGYATISLRTKKIEGLREIDFIMAAKIDELATAAA
jgi:4a-hydroxytetrahydrobiopterin dehydratase